VAVVVGVSARAASTKGDTKFSHMPDPKAA